MRKILIIFSVMIFIIANVGLSQDIINETGKDGKFIVRDAEQQEALVIEDGNVGITGELSVEQMPEGSSNSPNVVWDPEDKKFKIVERIFSELSPLSEPLETKSWHSISYDQVDDDGNIINTSVQGTAAAWNVFTTDYGQIHLGPADSYYCHIYTGQTRFLFNKPLTFVDAKFGSQNNQNFQIQTGGINRITVDGTNGNVGIGNTAPSNKLHVSGGSVRTDSGYGNRYYHTNGQYTGAYASGNDWYVMNFAAGEMRFGTSTTTGMAIHRLMIKSDGKIGINKASPSAGLHLVGDDYPNSFMFLESNTGNDAGFRLLESTTTQWHLLNDGSAGRFEIRNNAYDPCLIIKQGTGEVGIGTDAMSYQLQVEDSHTGYIGLYRNTYTTGEADGIRIALDDVTTTSGNDFITFSQNGFSFVGAIEGDGAGGISWNDPSDARLKTNIREMTGAMDLISRMKVKKYEMISAPGIEKIGFLAQELQEVYPMSVSGDPNGDVKEEPMGIDAIKLVPILVQAIQELQAEIEILKNR